MGLRRCYLENHGARLGMLIDGEDESNPVLLICGGGPGIPEYLLECFYPTQLSSYFTVCYLEYRGTGLSFAPAMSGQMATTEEYLSDIYAVTEYLQERFEIEKIYLMGHSFGTCMAIQAAWQHPECYYAYIAQSQMTNQYESEKLSYRYMMDQYTKLGNQRMVKKFRAYPIEESAEIYEKYFISALRDKSMHQLGVGTARDMSSVISGIVLPSLKCKEYTLKERINIWRGKMHANHFPVTKEAWHTNFFQKIPALEIPVYFFAGKYDYTCFYELQKKYYELIQAPQKAFYSFEKSAHSPIFEEPEKAIEIMIRDILAQGKAGKSI